MKYAIHPGAQVSGEMGGRRHGLPEPPSWGRLIPEGWLLLADGESKRFGVIVNSENIHVVQLAGLAIDIDP